MVSHSGTYTLILKSEVEETVEVGKLGTFFMPVGYYAYVGSALGPGGVGSRIARHLKKEKVCRWHIDYISKKIDIIEVWYNNSAKKLECFWSDVLRKLGGTCPCPGFGASDCKCRSHLFYFEKPPNFRAFKKANMLSVVRKSWERAR